MGIIGNAILIVDCHGPWPRRPRLNLRKEGVEWATEIFLLMGFSVQVGAVSWT